MANGVGPTLSEARKRRQIELSAVEAATRIRPRFLRAIENEEWDVLPGGVYTRGFIRTYATYLGLDGERLAEDYRSSVEGAGGGREPGAEHVPVGTAEAHGGRRSVRQGGWIAVAAVVLIAVIAIVALPGGDGGGGTEIARQPSRGAGAGGAGGRDKQAPTTKPRSSGVSLRLDAKAEVWVCLLAATGQRLVNGQILGTGTEEGPFYSGSFTVSFGNGEISMFINGKEAEIPATSSPIGYSIDLSGSLTQLSETERPTCA
jgi:cytoskeleton protein RodZ